MKKSILVLGMLILVLFAQCAPAETATLLTGETQQDTILSSGICTANKVNMRAEPATNAKVLGQLSKGDMLTVLEVSGEWSKVRCGIDEGYIRTQYIETIDIDESLTPYLTVGNSLLFGTYEQDNNSENGPEPVEWIILDADGPRSLLISKQLLDVRPFHNEKRASWGQSSLRKWLNKDFIQNAFSESEQNALQTTAVKNDKSQGNSKYSPSTNGETKDKVFLLSYAELMSYMPEANQRTVEPTPYAIAQGATLISENQGKWWLRSPGKDTKSASVVGRLGSAGYADVTQKGTCIRPVIWIDVRALKAN